MITDTEAQATVLHDELSHTYNNNLYTPLAHKVPTKFRHAIQLIKGNHHDGGRPLEHIPTKPGRSKFVPHIGKKQLAKLNRKSACALS